MDNINQHPHPPLPSALPWQPMPPPAAADVAAAGPLTSLPPKWEERRDPTTGRMYYIDHERQITTWEYPNLALYRAGSTSGGAIGISGGAPIDSANHSANHHETTAATVEASNINVGDREEEGGSSLSCDSHHQDQDDDDDDHNPHARAHAATNNNNEWHYRYSHPTENAGTIANTNKNENENAEEEGMQNDEHENAKVKEDEEEGSNDANNGNDVAKDEYAEGGGMNSLPPYPLHSTTTAEANDSETHHVHLNNNSIDDGDGDGDGDGDEVYINQHQHQQSEQQQQQQEQHEDHLLPEYNHETMSTIPSSSSSSSRYRALNDKWDKTMDELRTFKQQHGHTNVPQKYGSLGRWVNNQRQFYSKKINKGEKTSLTEDRVQELDEIGFVWALKSGRTPSKKKEPQSASTSTTSSASSSSTIKKRKRKSSSAKENTNNDNDDDDDDDDGEIKEVSNSDNIDDEGTNEKKSKKKKKKRKQYSKDDNNSASPTNANISIKTLPDGTHVITTNETTTHADGSKISTDVEESISKRLIRTSDGLRRVLETTTRVVSTQVRWVVLPELSGEKTTEAASAAAIAKNQDGGSTNEYPEKIDASVAVADALLEEVKKKKKSQPLALSVAGPSENATVDEYYVADHATTDASHNGAQSGESEEIQQPEMKAEAGKDGDDVAMV